MVNCGRGGQLQFDNTLPSIYNTLRITQCIAYEMLRVAYHKQPIAQDKQHIVWTDYVLLNEPMNSLSFSHVDHEMYPDWSI